MGLVELGEARQASLLLFGCGPSQLHVKVICTGLIKCDRVWILKEVHAGDGQLS